MFLHIWSNTRFMCTLKHNAVLSVWLSLFCRPFAWKRQMLNVSKIVFTWNTRNVCNCWRCYCCCSRCCLTTKCCVYFFHLFCYSSNRCTHTDRQAEECKKINKHTNLPRWRWRKKKTRIKRYIISIREKHTHTQHLAIFMSSFLHSHFILLLLLFFVSRFTLKLQQIRNLQQHSSKCSTKIKLHLVVLNYLWLRLMWIYYIFWIELNWQQFSCVRTLFFIWIPFAKNTHYHSVSRYVLLVWNAIDR